MKLNNLFIMIFCTFLLTHFSVFPLSEAFVVDYGKLERLQNNIVNDVNELNKLSEEYNKKTNIWPKIANFVYLFSKPVEAEQLYKKREEDIKHLEEEIKMRINVLVKDTSDYEKFVDGLIEKVKAEGAHAPQELRALAQTITSEWDALKKDSTTKGQTFLGGLTGAITGFELGASATIPLSIIGSTFASAGGLISAESVLPSILLTVGAGGAAGAVIGGVALAGISYLGASVIGGKTIDQKDIDQIETALKSAKDASNLLNAQLKMQIELAKRA